MSAPDYGRAIRILRAIRAMEQRELADAVGITGSYLSLIESGKRPMTAAVAERVSKALSVSTDVLESLAGDTVPDRTRRAAEKALLKLAFG